MVGTRAILWYNCASAYAMADRVPHRSNTPAAPLGTYAYVFSYRTWRFS
jgi:hypothetical protein